MASELSGIGPQTLRLYERRGLLTPARTEGGTRRYSDDDLDRLRQITDLLTNGVNLTGIAQILDLQTRNTELETGNTELETDNAELRSDNADLRSDNAQLETDNADLRSDNAQLRSNHRRRQPSRNAKPAERN